MTSENSESTIFMINKWYGCFSSVMKIIFKLYAFIFKNSDYK